MPIDYVSQVSTIQFHITYGTAHPGQNFESVSPAHFSLQFGKVKSRAGYVEKLDSISYLVTGQDLLFSRTYGVGPLLPASFTIITSRTSPLEPQPVIGAQ